MNIFYRLFAVRPRREMKELYAFTVLFSFASALILIFEPVFFYQEGITLSKIAFYYALHYALYAVLMPLGGKFVGRFGSERSLSLAMPLFVIYFLTLASLPWLPGLFWVAWILLTLFKLFYWPAYHTEVCLFSEANNQGTELSWLYALSRGAGVLGPLAGGLIAAHFGFPVLFVAAACLALLAVFPLLRTKEDYRRLKFNYGTPWRIIASPRHRKMVLTMIGWGENLIDMVLWPIFMFIILGGAARLGLVASLNVLVMMLVGFFVGEISDRFSRKNIIRMHMPFMILGYLFRPVSSTPLRVLLTDTLSKTAFIGIRIPMWYRLYKQGRQVGALQYVVALEMALAVSKGVVALVLVAVFATVLPFTGFTIAWLLAAALVLMYVFL